MIAKLTTSDDELEKVLQAFQGPLAKWRTAGGVSRDADLPVETVMKVIQSHPDRFRKSVVTLGGIPVFGLRRRAARAS